MADLEDLHAGYPISDSLDAHGNRCSRMPQILAALPPSLRIRLPKDFLGSHRIMVLSPPANALRISRQKAAFVERIRRHKAQETHEARRELSAELPTQNEDARLTIPSSSASILASSSPALHGSMEDLISEFEATSVAGASLSAKASDIVGKLSLELVDIVDRGAEAESLPIGRFGLRPDLLLSTDVVVKQMQTLLTRAFSLAHGQPICFAVDPHATLMQVLRSASTEDGLRTAWGGLRRRMALALVRLEQYKQHYQMQKNTATDQSASFPAHPPRIDSSPPALNVDVTSTPSSCALTPKRHSQNALPGSTTADPQEQSTLAAGPSVRALVARIETAVALDRESPFPVVTTASGDVVEPGGPYENACTKAKFAASLNDKKTLTVRDLVHRYDSTQCATSSIEWCARVLPQVPEIRSSSKLQDHAPEVAQVSSSSKSPAPAPATANAVELGGLPIEMAKPCTRTSAIFHVGRRLASITSKRSPNSGWSAWQAAEARFAQAQSAAKTSARRLAIVTHKKMLFMDNQHGTDLRDDTRTLGPPARSCSLPTSPSARPTISLPPSHSSRASEGPTAHLNTATRVARRPPSSHLESQRIHAQTLPGARRVTDLAKLFEGIVKSAELPALSRRFVSRNLVAIELGKLENQTAKSNARFACADALTTRNRIDGHAPLCLKTAALAIAHVAPSPKSPAPAALASANALESGGLCAKMTPSRANANVVERGGHALVPSRTAILTQQSTAEHADAERTMNRVVHPNADVHPSLVLDAAPSTPSRTSNSSPPTLPSLVLDFKISALVSAVIRTSWISHLGSSLAGERAPYRVWEREGIGTRVGLRLAGAGARKRI
ncbi:hypothetical protein C8R46DRAFT_1212409 [Mycena filopes]|nr:hypothetical protein C8R46DRAFT_1212409 [Mycena filopes]